MTTGIFLGCWEPTLGTSLSACAVTSFPRPHPRPLQEPLESSEHPIMPVAGTESCVPLNLSW